MFIKCQLIKLHDGKIIFKDIGIADTCSPDAINKCQINSVTIPTVNEGTFKLYDDCVYFHDCKDADLQIVTTAIAELRKQRHPLTDLSAGYLTLTFDKLLKETPIKIRLAICVEHISSILEGEYPCRPHKQGKEFDDSIAIELQSRDPLSLIDPILLKMRSKGLELDKSDVQFKKGKCAMGKSAKLWIPDGNILVIQGDLLFAKVEKLRATSPVRSDAHVTGSQSVEVKESKSVFSYKG